MRLGFNVLNNFRNLNSLYRSLGARWALFRLAYALRMRTGLLRRQIPAYEWRERPLATWLKKGIPSGPEAYARWRRQNSPRFFFDLPAISPEVPWDPQSAVEKAERILNGELAYFAHQFVETGFPPDWHTDPVSGKKVDASRHWSEIPNDTDVDIKFIWEASRFSMVYTLVRAYAFTHDERFARGFWELVEAWAASNPPNRGPNWMDGQEVALRLMAWTFGFQAFRDAPSTTPERMAQFTVMVAAQARRIRQNVEYAISTHSNHTVSEALGLWLVGVLFPELRDGRTYLKLGQRLLEQEAIAQIFPDGSYAMYALNYHRFVLHIFFYAIRLGELNGLSFSEALQTRVARSVDYLHELIDPETGQMPVYGSNDGALVLPLNDCDFTDYRPLLQLGSYVTRKQLAFAAGPWDEDLFWLYGAGALSLREREAGVRAQPSSFPYSGTHVLGGAQSRAVIRCTRFRSRPSHADQLHVDLWLRGRNIACDAGTYLYSGAGAWRNGLARTSVHNTVLVDGQDQMKMVSRFIWTDWAQGNVLRHARDAWQGEHDGYRRLPDPVTHKRSVLAPGEDRWLVVDHLEGKQPHHYALHWLLSDAGYEVRELAPAPSGILLGALDTRIFVQVGLVQGTPAFSVVRADPNSTRGWRSRYYADKEPAISILLEADQPQAVFWSFFGEAGDSVEQKGNTLHIRTGRGNVQIDLGSLNK